MNKKHKAVLIFFVGVIIRLVQVLEKDGTEAVSLSLSMNKIAKHLFSC